MAKVKIYDGSKWVKPSEVNANPTLAGTETELSGLEIDGVKYKIPVGGGGSATGNGALYKHVITFPDSNDVACTFTFLSKYSDVFVNGGTPQDFLLAINAKEDDNIIISPMLKKSGADAAEIVNSIAVNTSAYAVEFKTASGSTFLSVFYDDLVDTVSTYIAGGSGSGSGLPDTTPTVTLTSETITLAFNEGVLPTHIKLSNGIIVDLQGNEYCAEGDETVAQSINSGRVVIVISSDFTSLPSVDMTNLVWTLIDNPSNFSFDDLPRFSDSSDVDDFPDSSGSDRPSSESSYTTISIAWSFYDIRFLLPKFEETAFVSRINQMIAVFNQLMSLSLPTISSYEDLETLYSAVSGQLYESVVLGGIIWAINYSAVSVQCCSDGPLQPTFTNATIDTANNTVEWSIDILRLNNGSVSSYNVVSDTNFTSPSSFKVDDLSL